MIAKDIFNDVLQKGSQHPCFRPMGLLTVSFSKLEVGVYQRQLKNTSPVVPWLGRLLLLPAQENIVIEPLGEMGGVGEGEGKGGREKDWRENLSLVSQFIVCVLSHL